MSGEVALPPAEPDGALESTLNVTAPAPMSARADAAKPRVASRASAACSGTRRIARGSVIPPKTATWETNLRCIVSPVRPRLQLEQLRVAAVARHQRVVAALLDDAPLVDDDDAIRALDGREPV